MESICKQIITVSFENSENSKALFSVYEICGQSINTIIKNEIAFCGKNGFSKNKIERDTKTPIGVFKIPCGFGMPISENLNIDYAVIDEHVWVDDPNSNYYNTMQVKNDNKKWSSAELLDIPSYKYCLVVGYNYYNPVPGKGSAIFIHLKSDNDYTAGCIALDEEIILKTIKVLDETKNPEIIIDTENNINTFMKDLLNS